MWGWIFLSKRMVFMNLFYLLKPKATVTYLNKTDTVRQGLEKLRANGFTAIPVIDDNGEYIVETGITERPGIPDQSGEWRYKLSEDGTAAVTAYEGSEAVISIPPEIDGYPVTAVGPSAFYNCRGLKKVSIPEGVTDIGASAFSWCTALEEADLPASLSSVGEAAFSWCYSLESIVIPDNVPVIEDAVFTRSGLKEATIPAGVESLGDSSFSHCKKLCTIRFMGTEEQWNGIKKDKDWNKKSNAGMKIEYVSP